MTARPPLPPGPPSRRPFDDGGFGDDAARRERLRDIQDVMGSLRRPVEAPDLTRSILARVEQEKPFVEPGTRRLVWISRLGFAASVAVAALGIALTHRAAPELLQLTSRPQPLSDVVSTAGTEMTAGIQSIRSTIAAAASMPAVRTPVALPPASAGLGSPALAPMPPAYSTTFVAVSVPARLRDAATEPMTAAPVVRVSRVPLAMTPAPRVLAADPRPQSGAWGASLSTSPASFGSVIVMQAPAAASAAPAPPARPFVRERVVLDRLGAGAGGLDFFEPAVPR